MRVYKVYKKLTLMNWVIVKIVKNGLMNRLGDYSFVNINWNHYLSIEPIENIISVRYNLFVY